jgi:hypothetical protein
VIIMSDNLKNCDSNLPIPMDHGDFDAGSSGAERVIQGVMIKFIDGRWFDRDGIELPAGTKMLALGTAEVLQLFLDGKWVKDIKEQPFPDLDELNAAIPHEQWSEGKNGPRPPWSHQYIAYLLNETDGALYTSINNTVGQEIAVRRLTEKVRWMRRLRGANIRPIVALDHRAMPTKRGPKLRPEFTIVDWRDLGGGGSNNKVESKPVQQLTDDKIGKPVKPVSSEEEMDDSIQF